MESKLGLLKKAVIDGQQDKAKEMVTGLLEEGASAQSILDDSLIAAMTEVGHRFEQGDLFVPEMLIAARAMQAGLGIIKPQLVEQGIRAAGKIVIGTVKGDLHDIGKNLVAMMYEGAGFEVIDLGTDVAPEKFAQTARETLPDIVGLSALLTTTMTQMEKTIEALEDVGIRDQVKVLIGGAPVTREYAAKIGADGYAADASRAVSIGKSLIVAKHAS